MAGAAGSSVRAPEGEINVASRLPPQGLFASPGLHNQTVVSGVSERAGVGEAAADGTSAGDAFEAGAAVTDPAAVTPDDEPAAFEAGDPHPPTARATATAAAARTSATRFTVPSWPETPNRARVGPSRAPLGAPTPAVASGRGRCHRSPGRRIRLAVGHDDGGDDVR